MAWYYGTYSCGHEGRTNIIGPTKNRQYIADRRFSGLCPECYEKEINEERKRTNEEALKKAKELELPNLEGSPKQVAWANTIRNKMLSVIDKRVEDLQNGFVDMFTIDHLEEIFNVSNDKELIDVFINVSNYICENKRKASFFIDNKETSYEFLAEIYKEMKVKEEESLFDIDETLVSSNETKHDGIVKIIVAENYIAAEYEKNSTFIKIAKELKFKWNGERWQRDIKETTGTKEDRAAELGNKLLNEGFVISIQDEEIRNRSVKGEYESECTRWIFNSETKDKVAIKWEGWNDKVYNTAMKLPSAKYNSGKVEVNVSHYEEIVEFAELMGFKFTKDAIKEIDNYKENINKVTKVEPILKEKCEVKDGLEEILSSSSEVIEDLKEED